MSAERDGKDMPIPIAKPWLGRGEAEAAGQAILSGWVTQGPRIAEFEAEFARCVGAPHAVAVSSCTTALHLALLAAGVGPGDEVVTVSHSFIATANAVRHAGARPVFVDIVPASLNIDPAAAERAIGAKTRAILCVHQLGMPCDLAALESVARRRGVALIEDAACAIGSEIRWNGQWERIGKPHGDLACFSFHPRKVLTTGDGGMITTANADWDRRLRLWRQHGMSVSDATRHGSPRVVFEEYPEPGFNYRLTDIQAAVGLEQLKKLPATIERRRALAARYARLLAGIAGLGLPAEPEWARSNWQSYAVRLPSGTDQRGVMQALLDRGIATRRGVMCAHREKAYDGWPAPWPLRESERAQDECILLPLFHEMTEAQQDRVAQALGEILAG